MVGLGVINNTIDEWIILIDFYNMMLYHMNIIKVYPFLYTINHLADELC